MNFGNTAYSLSSDFCFCQTLHGIVASGGEACPEWVFSGIEVALQWRSSSTDTNTVPVFFIAARQNTNDSITFTDVEILLTSKSARLHSIISYSGCDYLDTTRFNLADTSGGLCWVIRYSSDLSHSIEILKEF